MRDANARAFMKVMAKTLALKFAVAVVVFAAAAAFGGLAETASAQDQDSGGYEPISSQAANEETTESVAGNIADGRDESTAPVEGSGEMEDTAAEEGSAEGDAPLPEASPSPPLAGTTARATEPAGTTVEPTMPATEGYEDTTPAPGATPESGGLSTTVLFIAPLLLGGALIGAAFALRGRGQPEQSLSDERQR